MFRATLLVLLLIASAASAQPSFPEPKTFPPDEATLKEIAAKTAELRKLVEKLDETFTLNDDKASVEVYLKAAEWIVRHGEWYAEKSGKQTLDVLEAGLERAKAFKDRKTPWKDRRDKPIAAGYRSFVDGSAQPYSLQYPAAFDPKKKYRLDVVLHGRDSTLTEVKFLAGKEAAKPNLKLDHIVLEVYGRGNNAYRWAGETDIASAIAHATAIFQLRNVLEPGLVLRGFSMGGAGTWHYGLHHSGDFAVIGPGAGFTTTRGYIKNLKEPLPEYIDKCLHIYDAVDYSANAFNVPVVAYSGEKDAQKTAADNIEKALKGFKEPHSFTHLIAPGLEHQQPAEWIANQDAEFLKHVAAFDPIPPRVRVETYTTLYGKAKWLTIYAMDEHYTKAIADARLEKDTCTITTLNVRMLFISTLKSSSSVLQTLKIDGQELEVPQPAPKSTVSGLNGLYTKADGKWRRYAFGDLAFHSKPRKETGLQGPIDAAFLRSFDVVKPTKKALFPAVSEHCETTMDQFAKLWDKHMRGTARIWESMSPHVIPHTHASDLILFGDPGSNPDIAAILPNLPITWTKDELIVNGVKYDPKTHYPVLIYPNLTDSTVKRYYVLNSGHTFKDADFRGTNALLYPRLGDWAVLKPKPTKEDPGAVEVVAAGIFDEFWQFKKEKK